VERILQSSEARASRTRTLIQLGGLVQKSGLPEVLRLPAGADLQRDHPDEAAIILGALLDAVAGLRNGDAETHRARLRALGAGTFKS
jgi:Conjugal transfer protein TraD